MTKQIEYADMKNMNSDLMKRYKTYWYYRLKNDVNNAKKFEAPHIQYIVSDEDYANYLKLFNKVKVGKIIAYDLTCEKEFYCCVLDKLDVKNGNNTERKDCWVKVEGEWYHNIYNPILFPYVK
jgi:hypothetical protein